MLTVSFWDWVDVEAVLEVVVVVGGTVVVGGRSRGAGTGGTVPAVAAGVAARVTVGTGTGGG